MGLFGPSKTDQILAIQYLKIAQDCARIVNTTKKPSIFFERYDLLISNMQLLIELEGRRVKFSGKSPRQNLNEILAERSLTIRNFIERYYMDTLNKILTLSTEKSKVNKANAFYSSLEIYSDKMQNENIFDFTERTKVLLEIAKSSSKSVK